MRPRSRFAFLAAAVAACLALPARVDAGAVVPFGGRSDPSVLDMRVAVSVSPAGTTRWSEVTLPPYLRALWLVPARPGATVAWASDTWLPALELATAPRISQPSYAPYCDVFPAAERTPSWAMSGTKQRPSSFTVHSTAESVRAAAQNGSFTIDADLDARITSLYESGWNLVAVEIESSTATTSSNTLRITDDGAPALPIALVGSQNTDTRITAFVVGNGVMGTNGGVDFDASRLRWGTSGSDFVTWRRDLLQAGRGNSWLRESASHAALFEGSPVIGGASTSSVVEQYLTGRPCETTAKNAGGSDGVVGESLASSTFACEGFDDLAIALDGLAPRDAVVTRWSGIVPQGKLGIDQPMAVDPNATQAPLSARAGSYQKCVESTGSSSTAPLAPGPTAGTDDGEVVSDGQDVVYVSDGCGGGTTSTTTYEEDEETTTTTSEDDCGGDTTTTSSSSDDGWDSSDDSGDSCSSDSSESSSSSGDSCSSGSSSSSSGSGSSDDGWDTEDDMGAKNVKTSLRTRPHRGKSPVSRYALFAVALVLPLRRRARAVLQSKRG